MKHSPLETPERKLDVQPLRWKSAEPQHLLDPDLLGVTTIDTDTDGPQIIHGCSHYDCVIELMHLEIAIQACQREQGM